jgi:hypothetical protein
LEQDLLIVVMRTQERDMEMAGATTADEELKRLL